MKQYLVADEWRILEDQWRPEYHQISESIFSIGNGHMGQRANFPEKYSGEHLQGSYLAGVYYPDKTKVGWWKIGYPEYFAKVLNAPNWIGIDIDFDGEELDLAKAEVESFERELNMQEGYLKRTCTLRMVSGRRVKIDTTRFCSFARKEIGALRYSLTLLDFDAKVQIKPYVDGEIRNSDANYDYEGSFWLPNASEVDRRSGFVQVETKKTAFKVATGMSFVIEVDGRQHDFDSIPDHRDMYAGCSLDIDASEGQEIVIYKYAANVTSRDHEADQLMSLCKARVEEGEAAGFDTLKEEHAKAWASKWEEADIRIEGDISAQQGIRFNIFQLYQTYTGEDPRLNIGPKGFTGEKYGGSTYWDTEAYCLPFYLATADPKVGRSLVEYRFRHLQKAIENAAKLGFKDGAALYPMVTMNGEECHNEWEITFEEIHRNGAIAYGIYDYINYTGDRDYLIDYGLEVLIGIARFWAQRVHYTEHEDKGYVMHGVTGPNEYENNVNNNFYTNYIARWCLNYAMEGIDHVKGKDAAKFEALCDRIKFYEHTETKEWKAIADGMYLPKDTSRGIYVQHDMFLEKELLVVDDLKPEERPINQNWSWDRILRSVFIKQADVLQGLYFFEDDFSKDEHRRNFEFYEPRTVHESSLSPCVHAILASSLGMKEKAYEMYLRTARLDLDDYNNDTEDGCHITSMAGTWLAMVKGFGGMRVRNNELHFEPSLPDQWMAFEFMIRFRGQTITVRRDRQKTLIQSQGPSSLQVHIFGNEMTLPGDGRLEVAV